MRRRPAEPDARRPGTALSQALDTGRVVNRAPWRLPQVDGLLLYGLSVLGLAGAYFAAALAGNALRFTGNVDAVWPPVGVGIAALYLGGLRLWPGVLIGDLLADLPGALPPGASLGQTAGNVLEIVAGAYLLRRLVKRGSPLDTVDGVWRLLVSIGAATLISAVVGTASLRLGGVIETGELPGVWRTWLLGDFCGALVVLPLALAWFRRSGWSLSRAETVEALLAFATVIALSELAMRSDQPVTYLVFPALIWAALRFGRRGATLAVAVAMTIAVWQTAHELGPFVRHSITSEALAIQLFIAAAALSTLFLAVAVSEREAVTARLGASRAGSSAPPTPSAGGSSGTSTTALSSGWSALAARLGQAEELALGRAPGTAAAIPGRRTELAVAIQEMRELAHGIHPSALTSFGLAAGRARPGRPVGGAGVVELALPPARLDPTVESTAYLRHRRSVSNVHRARRGALGQHRRRDPAEPPAPRDRDDGVGGASVSGRARASRACATASRRRAARSGSPAGPASGTEVTAILPLRPNAAVVVDAPHDANARLASRERREGERGCRYDRPDAALTGGGGGAAAPARPPRELPERHPAPDLEAGEEERGEDERGDQTREPLVGRTRSGAGRARARRRARSTARA